MTGRLLLGDNVNAPNKRNTCYMHSQELAVGHALGVKERRANNEVVDCFEVGKNLRKKTKVLCSYIMDNKVKSRYQEFRDQSFTAFACDANRLELPNDTRVSGTFKLFTSCLRSKNLIIYFCNHSKDANKLLSMLPTEAEWEMVVQFEAVLQITNSFAMSSQVDYAGFNCWAYYCMAHCKSTLKYMNYLRVIDFLSHSWSHKMLAKDIPRVNLMKVNWNVHAAKFVERLIVEYEHYFPGPDDDMILMMYLHP